MSTEKGNPITPSSLPANLENSVAFTPQSDSSSGVPKHFKHPDPSSPAPLQQRAPRSRRAAHTAARFLQRWLLHPAHLGSSPPGLLPLPLRHPARQSGLRRAPLPARLVLVPVLCPQGIQRKNGLPRTIITLQTNNTLQGGREKIKPSFIHQGFELPWVRGRSHSDQGLTSEAVEIPRKGQYTTLPRHKANTSNSYRDNDVKQCQRTNQTKTASTCAELGTPIPVSTRVWGTQSPAQEGH